ncbi:MAG: FeoB small GTPase domain-containing protein [Dialister invisus]
MLADYTGIRVPVVLLLNMMDVAKSQGKQIDTNGIAKSLGIPVVPLVAADKKQYGTFFRMLESIDKNASTLDEKRLAQIYQNTIGTAFDEIKALASCGRNRHLFVHMVDCKADRTGQIGAFSCERNR